MKRKEILSLAAERAFCTLDFTPGPSRTKRNVQKRSAIAVAMKPYCSHYEIGHIIQRDRTAVYHYLQHHEANMKYWDGYSELYLSVKPELDDVLSDYNIKQKIAQIDNEITRLIQARDAVKSKLEVADSDGELERRSMYDKLLREKRMLKW